MSRTKNDATRCDWCGKLSRNPGGEYTKPDGVSAGYIHQPEWERFPGGRTDVPSLETDNDICEECAADRCPGCGSFAVVRTTPAFCTGSWQPSLWGGRCKACGHEWKMPDHDSSPAAEG